MRSRLSSPFALVAIIALTCLMACAGEAAVAPSAGSAAAPAVHVPWVKMNKGQRIDYMVKTVMPKMKAEFQAFDAKRFERMDCGTCHGDGVDDGKFELPNSKLPKLLEPDLFAKHRQLTPAITKFMLEKVEPEMAALLEVPEFDPATHQGLSCYLCHPREIEPGKPVPPPAQHF